MAELWRSPSAGAVTRLAGAATLAQAIPLAVAPALTRMLDAGVLGAWALFASVAATVGTVACGRYEYAIVVAPRAAQAAVLLQLCAVICLGVTVATAAAVGIAQWLFADSHLTRSVGSAIWWLPLVVAAAGAMQALTLWHNRRGRFATISNARVANPLAIGALQLVSAASRLGSGGLIAAQALGSTLGPLLLLWAQWRQEGLRLPSWRWRLLGRLAARHKAFPLINAPHAFVNALQEALAIGVITAYAGVTAAGHYALMMRLAKAPVSLVGGALSEVLLGKLARLRDAGADMRPLLREATAALAILSLVVAVPLLIGGPQLFRLLLGDGWEASGGYARMLVPYLVGHFIVGPLTITPMVIGRQSTAFGFSVVGNLLFVGAIAMVLMPGGNLEQAFLLVSVTQAAYFLAFWLWLVRASGARRDREALTMP